MKIKSLYDFIKWEITKVYRRVQFILDRMTWRPSTIIDVNQLLISFKDKKPFVFIQIGANDGITGDKLHDFIEKFGWNGILVEPVPNIFKRLKNNYSLNKNLEFENSAIGKVNGYLPFYSISEINDKGIRHKDLLSGFGLDQLGSFDKMTILKHSGMIPDFESFIKEIRVPTLTMNDLFNKYSINKLDLLQIDTEGYDFEILNHFSFNNVKPEILIFEHQHMTRNEYKVLVKKISKAGYRLFINGWDTIAVKKY